MNFPGTHLSEKQRRTTASSLLLLFSVRKQSKPHRPKACPVVLNKAIGKIKMQDGQGVGPQGQGKKTAVANIRNTI